MTINIASSRRIARKLFFSFSLVALGCAATASETRHLQCQVDTVCQFDKACISSARQFTISVSSDGKASTTDMRGSVPLESKNWTAIAPFWFVQHGDRDEMEMLYLGYDLNFMQTSVKQMPQKFRISDELARRGGPIAISNSEVRTMTGVCS